MTSKEKTKSLVNKATTDDRNPPSGYLLKELANRTLSISECQTIEDLVIKKLTKNKPYIKYKALRIVKFLCENGSPNWRRAWQRSTEKLRDAQQFRGAPDPIYGDAPYQQVRKAAKDAMQAVFQQSTVDSSHIKQRIKSIDGGSAYGGYSGASSNQQSTFSGGSIGTFGGSFKKNRNKAPTAPSWESKSSIPTKSMPGFGSNGSYVPSAPKTFQPLKSSGVYRNPSASNRHSRGKLDNRGTGTSRKKGGVGGVWGNDVHKNNANDDDDADDDEDDDDDDEDDDEEEEEDSNSDYDSFPTSKRVRKSFGGNIKIKKPKSKKSDGKFERNWVDKIIKGGGIGAKIPDIDKYVRQFETLSQSIVLEYIDEQLEERNPKTWKQSGKALTLINGLLNGKSTNIVIDYFNQSPDNIQSCVNANKSILRKKANSIIEHLNIDDDEEEEEDDHDDDQEEDDDDQVVPQQPPAQDLLNMGGSANNTTKPSDDLFANLNADDDAGVDGNGDGDDMFANLGRNDNNKQGNNDVMSLIPDNIMNTQESQQTNKKQATDYDFLNDLATNSNVIQQNNAGGILGIGFGTTQNKEQQFQEHQQHQTQSQSQTQTQSAFGFALGGGNNSTPQQTQPHIISVQQPSSAFGINFGGHQNQPIQSQPIQNQSSNQTASSAFNLNLNNNMMTPQIMQQSKTNQFMLHNNINQIQQIGNMMNNMNMNNMNNMNQMNQMNMNNMMHQRPNQISAFAQTMQSVGHQPQIQQQQQQFVHNDPFAQMMNQPHQTTAPARKTKLGPDPFSEFSINALQ